MRKKSQEEMVGFVIIIILVSVIALIFLAISIRKPVEMEKNKEIENFLQSSLLLTTSCLPSSEITYDFKDLIKACYENEKCMNEQEACEILNKTAFDLVENNFDIGEKARYKAYEFKIYDKGNNTLVHLTKGKQTASKTGGETYIYAEGQNLYVRMYLFY